MKSTTIGGLGLLAFVLLTFFTVVLTANWIEDDLAKNSQERLESVGQGWATVEMHGRDAVLSGVAPDAEAATKAADAVASVWGVRVVADEATKP